MHPRRHANAERTCGAFGASLYQRSRKGRFRSGQTGQTVNLLALRLRWFESSPAHAIFHRRFSLRDHVLIFPIRTQKMPTIPILLALTGTIPTMLLHIVCRATGSLLHLRKGHRPSRPRTRVEWSGQERTPLELVLTS